VADKDAKYTVEAIRTIALKVAKDFLDDTDEMKQHVLLEIMEALDAGEDVYDELLEIILTRPYMEKFVDGLFKYEKE